MHRLGAPREPDVRTAGRRAFLTGLGNIPGVPWPHLGLREDTMATKTSAELLDAIREARRFWRSLTAEVGEARFDEPGPMGDWTFADMAGHLAGWRNRTIARVEAAGRGGPEPANPWPAELDDDDR